MSKKIRERRVVLTEKEEAEICLSCNLPAYYCDTSICKRYKEQKTLLKELKRKWVEKKPHKSI